MTRDKHESIRLTEQCFPTSVILLTTMLQSPVPEQIPSFDTKDLMFWWDLAKGGSWEMVQGVSTNIPAEE